MGNTRWIQAKNLTIQAGGSVTTGKIIGEGSNIGITGNAITVDNNVAATGNGTVNLTSTGNITLNSGNSVQAGGNGNSLVINSTGGSFINNAGASALQAPNGRWLVYSDTPANTTEGGLSYSKQYNRTFANNAPASIASGNHILYSFAPSLSVSAQGANKTYGALNPSFSLNTITGFIDDDTALTALTGTPTVSTVATQSSDVGLYDIDVSLGTLASSLGYQFSFSPGTLTINKAPLTVSTIAASKTYGALNPSLSASYSGFVLSQDSSVIDTLASVSTLATQSSDVGTYDITATGALDNNYSFTYTAPSGLTVNPAPLSITAANATKRLGEVNPAFSVTYNGFVLGQTESILTGTLGFLTPGENTQGLSAITPFGLSHANYGISFLDGVFTVGARPIVNLGVPYLLNPNQSPNTVTPMQFSQKLQLFTPTLGTTSPLAIVSPSQTVVSPAALTLPPSPPSTQFFGGLFTIIHPRKKYGEP